MRKKRKYSYGTDLFDLSMILDEPKLLNKKGLKKRMNWKRRKLLQWNPYPNSINLKQNWKKEKNFLIIHFQHQNLNVICAIPKKMSWLKGCVMNVITGFIENKMKVHLTKKYARFRVRNPLSFIKSSFRTQDIGRKGHSKRIAGILKANKRWVTQAILINRMDYNRRMRVKKRNGRPYIYKK